MGTVNFGLKAGWGTGLLFIIVFDYFRLVLGGKTCQQNQNQTTLYLEL